MEIIKHILGFCEHSHHINIFTIFIVLLLIKLIYGKNLHKLGRGL